MTMFSHLAAFHLSSATLMLIVSALGARTIDWIMGIILAIKEKRFKASLLPSQLVNPIFGEVGALSLAAAVQTFTASGLNAGVQALIVAGTAAVWAASISDIKNKITFLFTPTQAVIFNAAVDSAGAAIQPKGPQNANNS